MSSFPFGGRFFQVSFGFCIPTSLRLFLDRTPGRFRVRVRPRDCSTGSCWPGIEPPPFGNADSMGGTLFSYENSFNYFNNIDGKIDSAPGTISLYFHQKFESVRRVDHLVPHIWPHFRFSCRDAPRVFSEPTTARKKLSTAAVPANNCLPLAQFSSFNIR